jgi:hypothetical protein
MKGFREQELYGDNQVATTGLEICLKLFRWMIQTPILPDRVTLNTVISAAVLANKLPLAEEVS